jgi:hypothetical protein
MKIHLKRLTICAALLINPSLLAMPQVSIREGEYLSENYIAALISTKSPGKASEIVFTERSNYIVKSEGQNQVVGVVINFHEGAASFVLKPSGETFVVVEPYGYAADNKPAVKIIDRERFVATWADSAPMKVVYVGSAEQWVANQILTGKYQNKNGEVVAFREDGRSTILGKETKCSMGLDYVRPSPDYLYCDKIFFGFQVQGDILKLFRSLSEVEFSPTPFFEGRLVKSGSK